jgi:hypothetical protein
MSGILHDPNPTLNDFSETPTAKPHLVEIGLTWYYLIHYNTGWPTGCQ